MHHLQLRSICVRTRIGHRQNATTRMRQLWLNFIIEFLIPNGFATISSASWIAALNLRENKTK